jgi:hypothetical protein
MVLRIGTFDQSAIDRQATCIRRPTLAYVILRK